MNTKWIAVLTVAMALVVGAIVVANAQNPPKAASQGSQLDKIIEQNNKILSSQDEILKTLSQFREDLLILKRRSS